MISQKSELLSSVLSESSILLRTCNQTSANRWRQKHISRAVRKLIMTNRIRPPGGAKDEEWGMMTSYYSLTPRSVLTVVGAYWSFMICVSNRSQFITRVSISTARIDTDIARIDWTPASYDSFPNVSSFASFEIIFERAQNKCKVLLVYIYIYEQLYLYLCYSYTPDPLMSVTVW